jgi:CRISPR-associated protein Cas5d
MKNGLNEVRLRVWGDFACFTRPEMKTERLSYDVMTPSAARGVLEAVLWKPAIRWEVHRIDVLRPVRWTSVRRNEVSAVVPAGTVVSAMKRGSGSLGMYVEDERQQRAGLFLRDVAYVVHARFHLTERAGERDNPAKFAEMFRRHAERGQCFMQPYLGCREFSAFFAPAENGGTASEPIPETRELGWMLHDLDYAPDRSGAAVPRFFQARLEDGVLHVPAPDSTEVRG